MREYKGPTGATDVIQVYTNSETDELEAMHPDLAVDGLHEPVDDKTEYKFLREGGPLAKYGLGIGYIRGPANEKGIAEIITPSKFAMTAAEEKKLRSIKPPKWHKKRDEIRAAKKKAAKDDKVVGAARA